MYQDPVDGDFLEEVLVEAGMTRTIHLHHHDQVSRPKAASKDCN